MDGKPSLPKDIEQAIEDLNGLDSLTLAMMIALCSDDTNLDQGQKQDIFNAGLSLYRVMVIAETFKILAVGDPTPEKVMARIANGKSVAMECAEKFMKRFVILSEMIE